MLPTPVVLIIFNRPETTKKVFAEIAKTKPERLFIIADGPRSNVSTDAERCAATRAVVEVIDWPCNVQRNYSEQNMGCKQRVSSGLTWVFEQVEEAIILEDDCLPHPTFFRYCAELLAYFKTDERVVVISGNNFQTTTAKPQYSYYFSIFSHIWGWATWRRAWQNYDGNLTHWPELRQTGWLNEILGGEKSAKYFGKIFEDARNGKIDTWDYSWTYSCWIQNGLTVLPARNLVSNIGFGEDATHTADASSPHAHMPTHDIGFPLSHPPHMVRNYAADAYTRQEMFEIGNLASDAPILRVVTKIWRYLPQAMRSWLRPLPRRLLRHY